MHVLSKLRGAMKHVRERGLYATACYAKHRLVEAYYERKLGIDTIGMITPTALGIDSPHSVEYYPSSYPSIYQALRHLRVCDGESVLVDYGCGKGRVLAVASTFPFKRVIGIELSQQLSDFARENLSRSRSRRRCGEAIVVTGDAGYFEVPHDVTGIFFYNPFHGPVLVRVLHAIHKSFQAAPRKLTIVFNNTANLEPILIDNPWLVVAAEFLSSGHKVHKVMVLEARL